VRQTAAAAAAHGLGCALILEARTGSTAVDYVNNGNVLLDQLFGATLRTVASGTDMNAELEIEAERLRGEGRRPYVIPGGGSNPIGALGYVDCAREIVVQADELDLPLDRIVTATGSAGTHGGLVAGLAVMGADVPVLGFGVRAPKARQEAMVLKLARETAALLGRPDAVTDDMVVADCDYVGEGYGLIDQAVIDALVLAARTDAIVLDPVYTGKAMKGLIALAKAGRFENETLVFLHTGGAQGLFGYQGEIGAAL
jgi:L-cysteate sulfo-lyase